MAELKFVPSSRGPGGGAPTGPEDSMLEQRVARLEQILERLEPKITEILLTGAKQADVQKVHVELAELRGKVSMLPTWWMLVVALVATWSAGAGIIFALLKATHP
jgi:hypothetical protein